MKMQLSKQPKWVQKHIESLNSKIDLAKELLKSKNNLNLHTLNEKRKIELIDFLLKSLKVDNIGSCSDRPNRANYKTLCVKGEVIGKVLIEPFV